MSAAQDCLLPSGHRWNWLVVLLFLSLSGISAASVEHNQHKINQIIQRNKDKDKLYHQNQYLSGNENKSNNNKNNKLRQGQQQRKTLALTPRIVGGEEAPKGRYPYMVALVDRSMALVCGGSLIAPNVVLTAAHCAYGILDSAVVGSWDLTTDVLVEEQSLSGTDKASNTNSNSSNTNSNNNNNINNNKNNVEIIRIVHEIMHPLFDDEDIRHDVMVLILETASSKKVVKINHNPELPSIVDTSVFPSGNGGGGSGGFGSLLLSPSSAPQQQQRQQEQPTTEQESPQYMENLTAIGFGQGSENFVLHRATLYYVPNTICENASDGTDGYEGSIFKDMICTFAVGSDACFGDSGGPLILTRQLMVPANNSSTTTTTTDGTTSTARAATSDGLVPEVEEIQVGVTSWGYTCADPNFPGVSSRISESYDFIRQQVCAFAADTASDDFNCAQLIASYTPSPTPAPVLAAPTISPAPTILTQPCLIRILLDGWAQETGWLLLDLVSQATVAQASAGTYTIEDEVVVQVDLIPGRKYRFIITDAYGDGLVGEYTEYAVILGTDAEQGERLVTGTPSFGRSQATEFTVPVMSTHRPTMEPTTGLSLATVLPTAATTNSRSPTMVAELTGMGHTAAKSESIPSHLGSGCKLIVALLLATTAAATWLV